MKTLKLSPLFWLLPSAAHADQSTAATKVPAQPMTLARAFALSDSTCTKPTGTKDVLVEPIIRSAPVPYWVKRPTREGQLVSHYDIENRRNEVTSKTSVLSLMHGPSASKIVATVF